MEAFITGSRAYGKPTKESDIDLVIFCSEEDAKLLYEQAQAQFVPLVKKILGHKPPQRFPSAYDMDCVVMRFGPLNLLCCVDESSYRIWLKGTETLKKIGPVDRPVAVALFKQYEKEYAEQVSYDEFCDRAEGKGRHAPKFPMPEGVPRG